MQTELPTLADDGLDAAHYPLPKEQGVCADIDTSFQYLQALQDLHFGRLNPSRFEPVWHSGDEAPDRQAEILAIAGPGLQDIRSAFDKARPALERYQNLRKVYARERKRWPLPHWPVVGQGQLLKPGMQDPRVLVLAERMLSEGYLDHLPAHKHDPELAAAVKSFQLDHSLQADGVIGPGTLKRDERHAQARRDQLRINLERFRWMAQDFEPTSLLVNVPAALLMVYQNGVPVWQTRTQVGRPDRQTPSFNPRHPLDPEPHLDHPADHFQARQPPQIRRDQSYLARHDLQVLDSSGRQLYRKR